MIAVGQLDHVRPYRLVNRLRHPHQYIADNLPGPAGQIVGEADWAPMAVDHDHPGPAAYCLDAPILPSSRLQPGRGNQAHPGPGQPDSR